jgi:hypothetical protein
VLPPCSPHLTLLATGSLEPSLLRGPARHRPFAPALHLHQRKLSRNLHLQYSAKSQSTPRCQSLVTARSDHPPVLGRSGPQVTPAPASPSSLSLSSRWWVRAGQHPLVHRGTDTRRRIGSETARGGIERRTVPGGGGFFPFSDGGLPGGIRMQCYENTLLSKSRRNHRFPWFYLVLVKHGNNSQFEKDISKKRLFIRWYHHQKRKFSHQCMFGIGIASHSMGSNAPILCSLTITQGIRCGGRN